MNKNSYARKNCELNHVNLEPLDVPKRLPDLTPLSSHLSIIDFFMNNINFGSQDALFSSLLTDIFFCIVYSIFPKSHTLFDIFLRLSRISKVEYPIDPFP